MGVVIGIDLGTTNSCVACIEDGVPMVVSNKAGYKTTPSVVAITHTNKRLIGHAAKRQAITNPTNTVTAAKRFIGREWESPEVQAALVSAPYELMKGPHDDVRIQLQGKVYSIPEIQAMLLTELRKIAEEHLGERATQAVITVPAYFNDAQRHATKKAGQIAGLDVMRIINEPTSAALAYGYGKVVNKTLVVYDLGGGTFDVSILEVNENVYEVITSNGDTFLGGEDFDNRVMDWLMDIFEEIHGVNLRSDKMAIQRIKDAAESAKITLSSSNETEIHLPFLSTDKDGQPLHLQEVLVRDDLEYMVEDLVDQTVNITEQALRDAKLTAQDIDSVLLVGGQTRMPIVQRKVTEFFQKSPLRSINPDEAVALGAAIQSSMLSEQTEDSALLLDLTPHSLGIEITGGYYKEIIPKDTPLPTRKSHVFTTETDGQTVVAIRVYQGMSSNEMGTTDSHQLLGEFSIEGLRPLPRGETRIEVFFDIDADGTVTVSGKDLDTGEEKSIVVRSFAYLTDQEIAGMIEDNQDYELQEQHESIVLDMSHQVEQHLGSLTKLLDKIRPALRESEQNRAVLEKIETICRRSQEALDNQKMEDLYQADEYLRKSIQFLENALSKAER